MPDASPLDRLDPVLRASAKWFGEAKVPALLIGGVATGLLTKPRATKDVDWLADIPEQRMAEVLAAAENQDIHPLVPDILDFARTRLVLPLIHRPSTGRLDVAIAVMPFELQAIGRAHRATYKGLTFPLPNPEDLVVTKAVANRPDDHRDIGALLLHHRDVDLDFIRRWVRRYARTLDSPDIVRNLERDIREADKEYARLTRKARWPWEHKRT